MTKINKDKLLKEFDKGVENFKKFNFKVALKKFLYVLEYNKNEPKILSLISICYHNLSNFNLAEEFINKAIEKDSNEVGYTLNKTNILIDQKKYLEAEKLLQDSLIKFSKSSKINYNIGLIKTKQNKFNQAIDYYNKSLIIDNSNKHTLNNLATALKETGDYKKALIFYKEAIKIDPFFSDAQFNIGILYLLSDKYKEGLIKYEYRKSQKNEKMINLLSLGVKKWEGEDLQNKNLIIYSEQGIGDSIQFIRFIKMIKKQKTKIILYIEKKIEFLFSEIEEVDSLIFDKKNIPNSDFYISIMSLPLIFYKLGNFPTPYNFFPKNIELDKYWKKKINSNNEIKIGIAWQGNKIFNQSDYKRSIPIQMLSPILNLKKFKFISLQKDYDKDCLNKINDENKVIYFYNQIDKRSFEDTLSIIRNLDLVITVDTSIAHISGTLGKETWVLLPFVPDFRWGLKKSESKWYSKIKLFRQKKINNWNSVLLSVSEELNNRLQNTDESF